MRALIIIVLVCRRTRCARVPCARYSDVAAQAIAITGFATEFHETARQRCHGPPVADGRDQEPGRAAPASRPGATAAGQRSACVSRGLPSSDRLRRGGPIWTSLGPFVQRRPPDRRKPAPCATRRSSRYRGRPCGRSRAPIWPPRTGAMQNLPPPGPATSAAAPRATRSVTVCSIRATTRLAASWCPDLPRASGRAWWCRPRVGRASDSTIASRRCSTS